MLNRWLLLAGANVAQPATVGQPMIHRGHQQIQPVGWPLHRTIDLLVAGGGLHESGGQAEGDFSVTSGPLAVP